jgi:predicted RNA binding protein YcfA (HicA-like mRNA interferase family)
MPELPSVTGEQTLSALCRLGFAVVRIKGSHHITKKPGHPYNVSVPVHKGETLKKGTLRGIISSAGITVDEFIAALG